MKFLNASFRAVGGFKKGWCFAFVIVDAVDAVIITTKWLSSSEPTTANPRSRTMVSTASMVSSSLKTAFPNTVSAPAAHTLKVSTLSKMVAKCNSEITDKALCFICSGKACLWVLVSHAEKVIHIREHIGTEGGKCYLSVEFKWNAAEVNLNW
jgi:hypothetical protein